MNLFPMKSNPRFAGLLACSICWFPFEAAAQSTWHVDVNGPTPPGTGTPGDPYTSVQFAIAQSTTLDGDSVLVHPGVYVEQIDFQGKRLSIGSSGGRSVTFLDGGGQGSVVSAKSNEADGTHLEGFTIRNGTGTFDPLLNQSRGGGIYCVGSSLRVEECTLIDNATLLPGSATVGGSGGGLYAGNSASVLLIDCLIASNEASEGGGAWFERSSGTFFFSDVRDNIARAQSNLAGRGGGIGARNSELSFDSGPIGSDVAEALQFLPARGGGLLIWGGSAVVLNALVQDNMAGTLSTTTFAGQGGGIEALFADSPQDIFIGGCEIAGNRAGQGGGFFGTARLSIVEIHDNVAQNGAGVYSLGALVDNSEIFDNSPIQAGAVSMGLGVFHSPGPMTSVSGTKIHGHSGIGLGLGVFGGTYNGCQIFDNHGVGAFASEGGGAYDATLLGCIVRDNHVSENGSANPHALGGGLRLGSAMRCMIFRNTANVGGGAHMSALDHCSVENNSNLGSSLPGGGLSGGSAVNSILWNNQPDDVSTSSGGVSWSDVGTGAPGIGNFSADPKFWKPETGDFYLRPDSPCIDAGNPASPNDPNGSVADMGAIPFDFSHYVPPSTYCTAKINSQGCTPSISHSGPPSLGGGGFTVRASNVLNQKPGILFWGSMALGTPFQGGFLCTGAPVIRTVAQSSAGSATGVDCSGSYAFVWSHAYAAAHGLTIGQRIGAQFWSRDQAASFGTGLTDALDITFIP